MQLHKTITEWLSNRMIKCSDMSKEIYGVLERNGVKNEICKYCDSLTVNQIVTFTASMSKFSEDGIIGARKHYSLSSMVIFTLQYSQSHYYFLSVFSNCIRKLLKENLWTTSVALN